MLTHNVFCDQAFTVLAEKLKRRELLAPVRKNLHALLDLLQIAPDSWVLPSGQGTYRVDKNAIEFVSGISQDMYTQVRGADTKLPGPSVYLKGFTQFDRTMEFKCS